MTIQLRPAQQKILQYQQGKMAVSAVPGSGKTFTLSMLAAQLIADGRINVDAGQQVLIVTYLNASVDNFRNSVRKRLDQLKMHPLGFDVRTLHSLALEIVNTATRTHEEDAPLVVGDNNSRRYLATAVDTYINQYPQIWQSFLAEQNTPQKQTRWRGITEEVARTFITTAKNQRYRPQDIFNQLEQQNKQTNQENEPSPISQSPLLHMTSHIYSNYEQVLATNGALDFDDIIWQAVDLLETRPNLATVLRQRWPYVLEDEAQDSVPLQEQLLSLLTGKNGNLVRVGDPNQAITSSFTAAHPRFFNAFNDQTDVASRPLPNSGRCAPLILNAANHLLHWVCDQHPVLEVRHHTFRRQDILPTPAGDAQPNPPNSEANIVIKVYKHREDEELPHVAKLAIEYTKRRPQQTVAVLVPTNQVGYTIADMFDEADTPYDNLLKGGTREREIASAIHAILAILANPLEVKAYEQAHASLHALDHPAARAVPSEALDTFHALLRSVHQPELFLYPQQPDAWLDALPANRVTEEQTRYFANFTNFLRDVFALRLLPIDDLTLALGDMLFGHGDTINEYDLNVAYNIAVVLRRWREMEPKWRLPELVSQLEEVATGRRRLPLPSPTEGGFAPEPGRITLMTQHSAKGLEWDGVFLVGLDGRWIPNNLDGHFLGVHDFLGGDPSAEATAQLHYLMEGSAGIYEGHTATESAHVNVISERLRLLYVGITRAKRFLHLSRSRTTRRYDREQTTQASSVMGALYQYLQNTEKSSPN